MPFPLHKAPRGLLELFRLRTLGANPPEFGEVVSPVVDVTEFYGADVLSTSASAPSTGAVTGAGITDTLTLTGQIRVLWASATFSCGAAAVTNLTVSIEYADAVGSIALVSQFFAGVNAGANIRVGVSVPGIIFAAGNNARFRAIASGTGAGVDHGISPVLLINVITGA